MNRKDSLAILGLLFTGPFSTYIGLKHLNELAYDISLLNDLLDYLENLDLDYKFVYNTLTDEFDGNIYHLCWGYNSVPLPKKYNLNKLYESEHDGQIWLSDGEKIRIGVWCEVDGFVAWLDEYKKVWVVEENNYE